MSEVSLSSSDPDEILQKTVVRCKKAQAIARPFTHPNKVDAGRTVEEKMIGLLKMTQEREYGELTDELRSLANLILDMQKGVLEQLLDSVETIERRVVAYNDKLSGSETEDTTDFSTQESASAGERMDEGTVDRSEPSSRGWRIEETNTMTQQRFMDRLRSLVSFQRTAAERARTVDSHGKVRGKTPDRIHLLLVDPGGALARAAIALVL